MRKTAFCIRISGDRRIEKQTDGQRRCVKPRICEQGVKKVQKSSQ